ncbi:hypothetical protein PBY51_001416 [Eleginops maclovinus]|nr:hypothetical protein PBY51_001416 [Eleginops maclovinus]
MERADGEKLLQKRKWSVKRRKDSKPSTPQWIRLMYAERRSDSFVLRGDEGGPSCDERESGSTKRMRDEAVSDGEHEG